MTVKRAGRALFSTRLKGMDTGRHDDGVAKVNVSWRAPRARKVHLEVKQRGSSYAAPPGIGACGSYGVRVSTNVEETRWLTVPSGSRTTSSGSPW